MSDPTYYRFKGGYKPIEGKNFEEVKALLLERVAQEHALELKTLINATEEKDRWSKCGCTGWSCKIGCPAHEIAF